MKNKCVMELLAPAGNLETAVAAFNAGADAVYLGMGKFNARNRAENFKFNDLARLLEFAHRQGKKVYLTLNTLILESELPEIMSVLGKVAQLPIDAVIVQDLGVLYLINRYFPHLVIHASTQMNIHNSSGIKALELLNVKRVILERQVTLDELRTIAGKTSMELEVFVHGSLCVSLSGRCLLSNYAENCSGNRGMCRQLCRRNYRSDKSDNAAAALSPRDLELIRELPELAKLNIASLKIEGRLRGPDYVVPVVQAYRRAIDQLPEITTDTVNMIRRTVSRPASSGALYGFNRFIDPHPQAVFGRNVGVIKGAGADGLSVLLNDRIHLGDKLRVVNQSNGSVAGFELTEIICQGRQLSSAGSGSLVRLPGRFPFLEGVHYLYKIGENGYDCKRQAAGLPEPRKTVRLAVILDEEGLHITVPELPEFEFHSEAFAPAERCSVTGEDLQEVFSGGNDFLRGEIVSLKITGQWFCARSVLKKLRRELFVSLQPHLHKAADTAEKSSRAMLRFYRDYQQISAALPAADGRKAQLTIPGFVSESDLDYFRKQIRRAARDGVVDYAVGGLHGIMLLAEELKSLKNINVSTVYPLPVANSQAAKLLKRFAVKAFEPWVELPESELVLLQEHSPLVMTEPSGNCELLATRVPLKMQKLIDKNDQAYCVKYDPHEKLYKLFASEDKNTCSALEKFRHNQSY